MSIPLIQKVSIARYILTQKLKGNKRYPLVLMLEPLFQCNLACAGCGKIDYSNDILRRRLSVDEALHAVDECGAPVVSIPGGEPLIHKEMPEIVRGIIERKKFVYLCTNALLLEQKIDEYAPSPYFTFSVHLDGNRERHDASVCREGTFDKAISAIKTALSRGFRVTANCTLYAGEDPDDVADFFDYAMGLGLEGIMLSPGYSYEHAPRKDVFMGRRNSKQLFREIFKRGRARGSRWHFNQSSLFLDFLAGNESYQCTPWSNPTYNIFGWQKPCYLLVDEGYAKSFKELMETTNWEQYGTGRNPKCDNCMAHCGYEGTAVEDTLSSPLKALSVLLFGPRVDGEMAPELPVLHGGHVPGVAIPVDRIGSRSSHRDS
ncbi:MAG TPA: adenosyl-hopene transferase HpnH [Gammaproteobacteria bacterium]|nr:adenosyl-hopene transferase HpnH [Gammaproteobacteria bacterium]